ncbi:hypothetical protein FS373_29885 [Shewanella sp. YLB-07]|nr:hypothetical protein [Shewanella sp. YLB-07]
MLDSNYNCTNKGVGANKVKPSCKSTSVDTAASFQIRDDLAELPWMDLQRLAEVSAYKPAASDR